MTTTVVPIVAQSHISLRASHWFSRTQPWLRVGAELRVALDRRAVGLERDAVEADVGRVPVREADEVGEPQRSCDQPGLMRRITLYVPVRG